MSTTVAPAGLGLRQLLRLAVPLAVVLGVAVFGARIATSEPAGPEPGLLAAADADACSLLTLQEMRVLVGVVLKDLVADRDGAFSVCSYLGLPGSGIDVVEVAVASPEALEREEQASAEAVFEQAVAAAGDAAPVALGAEAAVLSRGVGEVWTRSGPALVRVAVIRSGPRGDTDLAAVVTRAALTKLGAD